MPLSVTCKKCSLKKPLSKKPSVHAADAYTQTDSEFLKSENNQNRDAGSTASTAILVGNRLLVANVGDSRAVICRGGNGKIRRFIFIFGSSFVYQNFYCNLES